MRRLSYSIAALTIMLIGIFSLYSIGNTGRPNPIKPPHGDNFNISCDVCHSAKGWKIDRSIYSFDHNSTAMPLIGQHEQVDCKLCHPTLIFSEAKTQCVQCHNDMHESTVGKECSRCHTPQSWLVNNITQIHQESRFPLVGVHGTADCYQCHKSESLLRFDVIGTECYSCHSDKYAATTQPNHIASGFSTNCTDCHTIYSNTWTGDGFNHSFFPLTQGHALPNCSQCHTNGSLTAISPECISCHQPNYSATTNPNHISANFSTDCKICHTTAPGWKPANFDHTIFPLTLGHSGRECAQCHINGNYSNTSSECVSCHQTDFNATTDPNHVSSGFSTDCKTCHNTAGWKPATFDHTNFALTQGHSGRQCAECHINGNYTSTSSECVSCHLPNYNATTNPVHSSLNFSTTCNQCHTTALGWKPASYAQHDALSFPIYSGKHNGQWSNCSDCHTNASNYKEFTCITCHQKTDMDDKHKGESGYVYASASCLHCHPNGSAK